MPTFPFDPNTPIDTPCNAYCMAAAARAAYFDSAKLEAQLLETWQFDNFHTFEGATIQGYLATGSGFSVLVFRGSDHAEVDDWIGNADFDLVFDPHIRGGQVHAGFQRGAASIWEQVESLVEEYHNPDHALVLTGHSLGGALAVLTAARFAAADKAADIDAIFTFGQPRTGDSDFARRFDRDFNDRTFRYVNRFDLITRLPPRLLGYDHAGKLRYIDAFGVLHENVSLWEQLLMTLNPRGKDAKDYINELAEKLPGAVGDHNGGRYIELLQALCPASS